MLFDYFDMLSGDPLYVKDVGHFCSPFLRELCPSNGIGYRTYNLYLNFLTWDKDRLLKYDQLMQYKGANKLNRGALNVFDVATLIRETREFCRGVLSFFMVENIVWDEKNRRYLTTTPEDTPKIIGEINRNNFEDVRKLILQLNFVGIDKDTSPVSHSSDKAKELWERAQGFLKNQAESSETDEKPEYRLSNIISKICAIHPSYNLLNVYNLTIFQLYDSFFQLGYMRSADLSERIFSTHGGEKFNFEDWLKPILKNM